jgi:hypothetical protein
LLPIGWNTLIIKYSTNSNTHAETLDYESTSSNSVSATITSYSNSFGPISIPYIGFILVFFSLNALSCSFHLAFIPLAAEPM